MATCPDGHESASTDFCDVCGIRISGAPSAPTPLAAAGPAPAAAEPCPRCGADRTGQFCETCGFDFSAGTAGAAAAPATALTSGPVAASGPASGSGPVGGSGPAATSGPRAEAPPAGQPGWTAVVGADRAYFDSVIAAGGPDASTIQFPAYCPERRFRLTGSEMRIGRRSASRGLEPEIDLTGPPADPGISHLHAVLTAQADGTWVVLDPGSSNGTQVNGAEIATGVQVPLHDGDRICLGGWTVLTIHADTQPAAQ